MTSIDKAEFVRRAIQMIDEENELPDEERTTLKQIAASQETFPLTSYKTGEDRCVVGRYVEDVLGRPISQVGPIFDDEHGIPQRLGHLGVQLDCMVKGMIYSIPSPSGYATTYALKDVVSIA